MGLEVVEGDQAHHLTHACRLYHFSLQPLLPASCPVAELWALTSWFGLIFIFRPLAWVVSRCILLPFVRGCLTGPCILWDMNVVYGGGTGGRRLWMEDQFDLFTFAPLPLPSFRPQLYGQKDSFVSAAACRMWMAGRGGGICVRG